MDVDDNDVITSEAFMLLLNVMTFIDNDLDFSSCLNTGDVRL